MSQSPRPPAVVDLRGFEARRLQTLKDHLTQEAIEVASNIIQCAMEAGQSHARVQTIFLSHNQFTYTHHTSGDTFPLHDCYTLLPLEGMDKRVCFSSCVRDFTHWLREQGLHFLCTTLKQQTSFVHIETYFVPEQPVPPKARALVLWNTVYTQKCVDDSAMPAWNQKCGDAIRRGASSFIVCTLYRHSDFYPVEESTTLQGIPIPEEKGMRHHLTMQPLHQEQELMVLNPKFSKMVQWVQELGYTWTLTTTTSVSDWAYFVVLLDPLEL